MQSSIRGVVWCGLVLAIVGGAGRSAEAQLFRRFYSPQRMQPQHPQPQHVLPAPSPQVRIELPAERPAVGDSVLPSPRAIEGKWVGQTEEDGQLTIEIGPGEKFAYRFSGGTMQRAEGTYKFSREGDLLFTPTGAAEPEEWDVTLADNGAHLVVKMEEDHSSEEETYFLSRAK